MAIRNGPASSHRSPTSRQRIERRSLPAMRLCAPSASRKPRNATDPPPIALRFCPPLTLMRRPPISPAFSQSPVSDTYGEHEIRKESCPSGRPPNHYQQGATLAHAQRNPQGGGSDRRG